MADRGARRRRLRCRAAASLRISTGTARNHLKSIFRKTGVRRQSDLVRLLLTTSMAWEARR
jgi:DNA-binding NarL/FixJ family response regulator